MPSWPTAPFNPHPRIKQHKTNTLPTLLTTIESGTHTLHNPQSLTHELEAHTLRNRAAALKDQLQGFAHKHRCTYCGLRHSRAAGRGCRHRFRVDVHASLLCRRGGEGERVWVLGEEKILGGGREGDIRIIHWSGGLGWGGGEGGGDVEIERTLEPDSLDLSRGVVRAVLEFWRDNQGGAIPFNTHVGIQLSLLWIRHQEEPSDQESRTKARAELARYVYLVSNPQMLSRLEAGKKPRNHKIFKPLTARVQDFPPGTFEQEIEDESLRDLLPNKQQEIFIKKYWRETHLLTTDDVICEALATQRLYRIPGRKNFHTMLKALLLSVGEKLFAVGKAVDDWKRAEWKFTREDVREMNGIVGEARAAVSAISRFMGIFEGVLGAHLEWLGRVAARAREVEEREEEERYALSACLRDMSSSESDEDEEVLSTPDETDVPPLPSSRPNMAKIPEILNPSPSSPSPSSSPSSSPSPSFPSTPPTTTNPDPFTHLSSIYTQRANNNNPNLHKKRAGTWTHAAHKYLLSISLYAYALAETTEIREDRRGGGVLGKFESKTIREAGVLVLDIKGKEKKSS